MAEIAVGIDLGTSNSCVAISRGGQVEVLSNAYDENTSASVVAFEEDGSITVGNAARANIIHQPEHTVYSAKRLIGRYFFSEEVKKAQAICAYEIVEGPNHSVRLNVRDEEFSLPEISAMVLREMKQIAESRLGEPVTQAVITVPAYFNDNQRQATKDAGKIAGLEVLRILNEPTAAALAYGFGRSLNQRVAVYDLGGGTFDVSILEIGADIFEVLSTCGDTFLGGDDFDDRLIDLLADDFVGQHGINLRNDRYAYEKLKAAAEAAKCALSLEEEVAISVSDIVVGEDGQALSLQRTITAAEYGQLIQDLIMRTFKVCDEALQQADLTARDLDGVILVGGPTRLPMIREAVSAYFQKELKADVDPDEVVAMGAAIHASSLVNAEEDAFLLDVTPLDLRMGVAGGLAEPIIEKNTPVPIEQTRRFTTVQDFQESVQIKVYQGDARAAEDNELLGQFEFTGFKSARRGDVSIDVTFEINADGIVNVTASDPDTGEATSASITLNSGLSDEELESIVHEDRAGRVETATVAPAAAAAAVSAAVQAPAPAAPSDDFEDLGGGDDLDISAAVDLSGDPGEPLAIDAAPERTVDPHVLAGDPVNADISELEVIEAEAPPAAAEAVVDLVPEAAPPAAPEAPPPAAPEAIAAPVALEHELETDPADLEIGAQPSLDLDLDLEVEPALVAAPAVEVVAAQPAATAEPFGPGTEMLTAIVDEPAGPVAAAEPVVAAAVPAAAVAESDELEVELSEEDELELLEDDELVELADEVISAEDAGEALFDSPGGASGAGLAGPEGETDLESDPEAKTALFDSSGETDLADKSDWE